MPRTEVVLYCEADGRTPLLAWLETLPRKAQDKCRIKLERLRELGHELRRPEADYLRDGIYELRIRHQSVHYRMLYFFHADIAAVVSHGTAKKREVPSGEIDRAIERMKRFRNDPNRHSSRKQI